ncbi:hypothetical protein L6164_017202 [Bauhinia variegata]|uniref:Uncharacterized protein n=1 Tax=Bauhinia variegata TaxID=167791 RepID=A0ACB9N773_BAUVA|nr:hypothetical protein L6164_017202 [Bauhinia variegata]
MVEKTKVMIEFDNKSNFKTFARLATLPGIEYSSSEGFTFFKSTKLAYDQLWEALQDDEVYTIALFGLGGSGKTTLVTEVGKKAKESNLFDRVVAVTVSQTLNVRNIQGQMADMLNFKLEEATKEGRTQRLHMRLKEEKRILIIVDDVWGEFNLKDIGINFNIRNSGNSKIILTTRCQQVCTLMDCQKKIWLDLLNKDEAWALFKKHADPDNQSSLSLLSSVAQDIARECKGLPIAIQAVGRSLKEHSIHAWKLALENLRSSKPVGVEHGQGDAFSCLKLSYDYLTDENKLLFLICCIFSEDCDISNEDLIRCVVGLGVYEQYPSFDTARSQVMVRDGVINDQFAVSSWYGQTNQISTLYVAAKLEILWIETGGSLDLSSASFEGLQGLKVMVLNSNRNSDPTSCDLLLPPSIESLTNLRTLCLRGLNLGDISFLVKLKKLKVLELKSCVFNELPNEIANLNKLKLLNLCECAALSGNNKAIGESSEIEELYVSGVPNSRGRWRNPSQSFVDNVAAAKLERYVLKFDVLKCIYNFAKAEYVDFNIFHGDYQNFVSNVVRAVGGMKDLVVLRIASCSEIECVVDTSSNQVNVELPRRADPTNTGKEIVPASHNFHLILPNLKRLSVRCCRKLESICPISCIEGLEKLKDIVLEGNSLLKYVFGQYDQRDHSSHQKNIQIHFPMLKVLILKSLRNPHGICAEKYHPRCPSLKKLQVLDCRMTVLCIMIGMEMGLLHLEISFCRKLKSLLPVAWARMLPQLSVLDISHADKLKVVFSKSSEEATSNGQEIVIPNLEELKFIKLPSFIGICPGFKLHAVNLVKMVVDECPQFAST